MHHIVNIMRTTLALDDDILSAARAIAARDFKTIGQVVSELARKSLNDRPKIKTRNGIPILDKRSRGVPITLELVNRLRDETP